MTVEFVDVEFGDRESDGVVVEPRALEQVCFLSSQYEVVIWCEFSSYHYEQPG